MRPHVAAVYAFARTADDLADEGRRPDEERVRLLDAWIDRLRRRVEAPDPLTGSRDDPALVIAAAAHSIRALGLPITLFEDLVSAFRQDVTIHRYDDWEAVLDYCRRSANPVGRLVLRIAGYENPSLDRASDAFCTALQLTNFWQDLESDWRRGRLYVPRVEWIAAGAVEADLDARRLTPAWRTALERAAHRTRTLYSDGREVCDGVAGRLGWELRLTWLGGTRILERLERQRFDVFRERPALGWTDAPTLAWRLLRWKRPRASS
jgi:squalene synthase HpnC